MASGVCVAGGGHLLASRCQGLPFCLQVSTTFRQYLGEGQFAACSVQCTVHTVHTAHTALHCTALHCTALHCTALHCTALHCTALHCCALHCAHCTACSVSVQCAVCSVHCALCIVHCALCSVQCAVCSVQCAVCSVQCAVCSVQCTVCSWLPGPLVGGAWLSLPASNPIPPLDYLQP